MSFLAGFVALFAVLGAIPIIIHLLNKRRFKVVVWAAMEFLLTTLEKNSRRLQLRDVILMALRTAAVVLFALALAGPTIAPGSLNLLGHQGETAAVIGLDNSLSRAHDNGAGSRFDAAKRRAKEIVEQLPKGSAAALVLMNDAAVDDIGEPSHDLPFVSEEIQRAVLSDGGTDVRASLAMSWRIASNAVAVAREIYVITDMQNNGWPEAEEESWSTLCKQIKESKPAVKMFVCDVGDGDEDNVSVDSLQAEDDLVTTESDVTFVATLRNQSAAPARNVPVDLLVGGATGDLRKVASAVIDSLASTAEVRLSTRFVEGGEHRVSVVAGTDHLEADNHRHLAINVVDALRVLLIDGQPSTTRDDDRGETYFLRMALALPGEENEKTLIQTDVTTVDGVGRKTLRDYAAIVLANVGELPSGLVETLATSVKSDGRGLLIFLGENVRSELYNDVLYKQAGLLPGLLSDAVEPNAESDKDPGLRLATTELTHPIVSYLASPEMQPFLAKPRFRKFFPLQLPGAEDVELKKLGDHVRPVARYSDQRPAIAERQAGRGSVILFTSTADKDWTDLPLTPAYLMLVRRAAEHVALGRNRKNVAVNDLITLELGARESSVQLSGVDPRGASYRVAATLDGTGKIATASLTETSAAGFYSMVRAGGENNDTTWFAANAPRQESNLSALDEKTFRARYPNLPAQWIGPTDSLAALVSEKRIGKEIWSVLLAIVALCLACESYLALRWAPKGT